MATKKRTKKKASGKKVRSSSSTTKKRRGGKKAGKKPAKKRASKKHRQTVTPPGPWTQLAKAPYGWLRIGKGAQDVAKSRWKRTSHTAPTPKALPAGTVEAMHAQGASHPLVQAYARAGGAPPGYVKSGPWVGPSRPWSSPTTKKAAQKAVKKKAKKAAAAVKKAVKAEKEAAKAVKAVAKASGKTAKKKAKKAVKAVAKAAKAEKAAVKAVQAAKTATKKTSRKKASKKGSKKRTHRGGRPTSGSQFAQNMAAARAAKAAERSARKSKAKRKGGKKRAGKKAGKRRGGRKGWPRAGAHKRTFGIAKFKAMHKFGVPPNRPIARAKRLELRQSAGNHITAAQVFEAANATKMKAWVCAGRVRTGCGGGSKMLRGSHQIGVFAVPRKS